MQEEGHQHRGAKHGEEVLQREGNSGEEREPLLDFDDSFAHKILLFNSDWKVGRSDIRRGLLASCISIPPWRIGKGGSGRIASPGKKEAFVKRKSLLPLPDCEFLPVIFYSFCERKASGAWRNDRDVTAQKKNDEAFVSSLFFCVMQCSLMLAS